MNVGSFSWICAYIVWLIDYKNVAWWADWTFDGRRQMHFITWWAIPTDTDCHLDAKKKWFSLKRSNTAVRGQSSLHLIRQLTSVRSTSCCPWMTTISKLIDAKGFVWMHAHTRRIRSRGTYCDEWKWNNLMLLLTSTNSVEMYQLAVQLTFI